MDLQLTSKQWAWFKRMLTYYKIEFNVMRETE